MSTDAQPNDAQPFDATSIIERFGSTGLSLYNQSAILHHLLRLKYEPTKCQRLRRVDSNLDAKDVNNSRDDYEKALGEINSQLEGAFANVEVFLDLGCAPGGFSTWVLKNNARCRGVGVTLEEKHNGRIMNRTGWDDFPGRYEFLEGDITDATVWPGIQGKVEGPGACNLVIAGAVFRDPGNPNSDREGTPEPQSGRTRLQISQVVLGLKTLQEGGNMLLVMWSKPFPLTAALLLLLKETFNRINATKGTVLHRENDSFYLVCEGRNANISDTLEKLKTKLDGEILYARSTSWLGVLGDRVVGDGETSFKLTSEAEREVLDILEPLWEKEIEVKTGRKDEQKSGRRRGSSNAGTGRPSVIRHQRSCPQFNPLT